MQRALRLGLPPVPGGAAPPDARPVEGLRRDVGREDPAALRGEGLALPDRGPGRRLVPPRCAAHVPLRRPVRHGVRRRPAGVVRRHLDDTPLRQCRVRLAGHRLRRSPRTAPVRAGHRPPGHGPSHPVAAVPRRRDEQPQGPPPGRADGGRALLPDAPGAGVPVPRMAAGRPPHPGHRPGGQRAVRRPRLAGVSGDRPPGADDRGAPVLPRARRRHLHAVGGRHDRRPAAGDGVLAVGPGPAAHASPAGDDHDLTAPVELPGPLRRRRGAGDRAALDYVPQWVLITTPPVVLVGAAALLPARRSPRDGGPSRLASVRPVGRGALSRSRTSC